jgi:hypothetical protein
MDRDVIENLLKRILDYQVAAEEVAISSTPANLIGLGEAGFALREARDAVKRELKQDINMGR